MADHKVIFLQPECGAGSEGRTWCEDDIDTCDCIGKKHKNTQYIRADLAQPRPKRPKA